MARIWTLLVFLPSAFCLIWTATAKGTDYDQSYSLLSYDFVGISDTGSLQREREKRGALMDSRENNNFYDIEQYVDRAKANRLWADWNKMPLETVFDKGYRAAQTLELPFEFPFFGQNIRNITVSTGGFIYTGSYIHSWLAATQYIAPLMANFYVEESEDSHIYVVRNETAFSVIWKNLVIKNDQISEPFTFSATLHKNGEIVFVYYKVPVSIDNLDDSRHPVKVGLSDAYLIQKQIPNRKSIYEYARIKVELIGNIDGTIVRLKPLPTCPAYKDCQSCLNHDISLQCTWCTAVNRCSTRDGKDRGKQQWKFSGCESEAIGQGGSCPVPEEISTTHAPDSTTYQPVETIEQSSTVVSASTESSPSPYPKFNPTESIKQCVLQCFETIV